MYAIKQATLLKSADPSRDVYIFYIDIRAFGKGYEEYYNAAQEAGVKFIRGKAAELRQNPETGRVVVKAEDTLNRRIIEAEFDTVSLSVGVGPSSGSGPVASLLKLARSADGFFQEAHPKFRPVDTLVPGVFLAGMAQGPKDIPDTVSQASGAAARAIALMNRGTYYFDPQFAFVEADRCTGCELCLSSCPYDAISMKNGKAEINSALCTGCGVCIGHCPDRAIDMHLYSTEQLRAEIRRATEKRSEGEVRILIFADDMTTYRLVDSVGTAKMSYSSNSRLIRIPSGGRVTTELILEAFAGGADAVLIADAEEKSSPYATSKIEMLRNVAAAREVLERAGIEIERLQGMEFVTVMLAKFVKIVNDLDSYVRRVGVIDRERRSRLLDGPSAAVVTAGTPSASTGRPIGGEHEE
jgi:heterodisulfide reductase subunit A